MTEPTSRQSPPRRARRLRRTAAGSLLSVAALCAVLFVRAARFTPHPAATEPTPTDPIAGTPDARNLAGALRFRTVSTTDSLAIDTAAFSDLHRYLQTTFRRVHAAMTREVVRGHALLYTWRGTDSSLTPIVLASHMDVVPVEPGTELSWTHDPFSGEIASGYVWGRGALDDKVGVVGILEAAELLLAGGFNPRRSLLFAFGHDEELGGDRGAAALASLIKSRHGSVALVVDEGSIVADTGLIPGLAIPGALIGIAEKGYVSVELSARGRGGHSSVPPRHTAVGVLSRAVRQLEEHQMPARLDGVAQQMFETLGRELSFMGRAVFANLWLFKPLVVRRLASSPATNAMIRTTTAATMFSGSPKDNVLPIRATAVVNFRILPGDSTRAVLDHVRQTVDDSAVSIRVVGKATEPSPVTSTDSAPYRLLARSVRQIFPSAVVAPYLLTGATDLRHYQSLTPHLLRFLPVVAGPADVARLHGTDERIGVEEYGRVVRFYAQLMLNAQENLNTIKTVDGRR